MPRRVFVIWAIFQVFSIGGVFSQDVASFFQDIQLAKSKWQELVRLRSEKEKSGAPTKILKQLKIEIDIAKNQYLRVEKSHTETLKMYATSSREETAKIGSVTIVLSGLKKLGPLSINSLEDTIFGRVPNVVDYFKNLSNEGSMPKFESGFYFFGRVSKTGKIVCLNPSYNTWVSEKLASDVTGLFSSCSVKGNQEGETAFNFYLNLRIINEADQIFFLNYGIPFPYKKRFIDYFSQ